MQTLIRLLVLLALGFAGEATALDHDAGVATARRGLERSDPRLREPAPGSLLHTEACLETIEEDEEESAPLVGDSPGARVFVGSTPAVECTWERPEFVRERVAAVRGPPRGRGTS